MQSESQNMLLAVGLCHMAAFRNEEELEVPLWLAFRFNDRHRFQSFEPRSVNAFRQQRNRRDAEPTVVARSVLATAAKAAQSRPAACEVVSLRMHGHSVGIHVAQRAAHSGQQL